MIHIIFRCYCYKETSYLQALMVSGCLLAIDIYLMIRTYLLYLLFKLTILLLYKHLVYKIDICGKIKLLSLSLSKRFGKEWSCDFQDLCWKSITSFHLFHLIQNLFKHDYHSAITAEFQTAMQ